MNKQTKLLLGVGAIAVALYLILRPKSVNAQTPPAPIDMCDFPQNCKDGTFGCDCANHGGVSSERVCQRGQFLFGNNCLDEGNYQLVLTQDADVSVMNRPDNYIQKVFKKNTVIEAILWAPADAPYFSTTYDGTIPTMADGEVLFTLPIEKIDFSKLIKI
jgi:hypothetical protein